MTSAKRARLARWLTGQGIEIGALHRPLPVSEGVDVRYVDHLSKEELHDQYPELADLPLVPVSVIGSAEDLTAFEDESLDFVIANHLLEHLEYPIRGLQEFHRVLRPGGLLYLALPDQRLTFDRRRTLTTVDHLLHEQEEAAAGLNRRSHYMDWAMNVDGASPGPEAEARTEVLIRKGYSIHFHVWRPDTFIDLLVKVRQRLALDFEMLQFAAPEFEGDDEFILLLARGRAEGPRLPPPSVQADARRATSPAECDQVGSGSAARIPSLRGRLAASPIGPPVRTLLRALQPGAQDPAEGGADPPAPS